MNKLATISGTIVDNDAVAIGQLYADAKNSMVGSIRYLHECGRCLKEKKETLPHGQWLPWLRENEGTLGFGISAANKMMKAASNSELTTNLTEADALKLNRKIWGNKEKFNEHSLAVMTSSESVEWYTPPEIVALVSRVLGTVDMDPCWHPDSPVRARIAYTQADNGLAQPWKGRLFLNPPYGRVIDDWLEKLVAEFDAGRVTEAVALVPARVDTEWFARLDRFPRCFIRGRLTFANADNPAPFPCAVVYLGNNAEKFAEVFGAVGSIWMRIEVMNNGASHD